MAYSVSPSLPTAAPTQNRPVRTQGSTSPVDHYTPGADRDADAERQASLKRFAQGGRVVTDWFGEDPNSTLPADGIIRFQVAHRDGLDFPDHIQLRGGQEARVEKVGAGYLVTAGSQRILEMPARKGFETYALGPAGQPQDLSLRAVEIHGRNYSLWRANSQQNDLAKTFQESYKVANGYVQAHLDPQTQQALEKVYVAGRIPATRERALKLSEVVDKDNQWQRNDADNFKTWLGRIAPLLKKGELTVSYDSEGQVALALARPAGASDSEWNKLQNRFGGKVADYQKELQDMQKSESVARHFKDDDTRALWRTIDSPEMRMYFAGLPPQQRLSEFSRLAGPLAGPRLTEELFGNSPENPAVDKGGVLRPRPDSLGAIVLKDCYETPEGRQALKGLLVASAPYLRGDDAAATHRMVEIGLGRTLTPGESQGLQELVASPENFAKLTDKNGSDTALNQRATALSDVLSNLGQDAPPGVVSHFTVGASFLATFSTFRALSALADRGANVDTVGNALENGTRVISVWGKIANMAGETESWLARYGKAAGVANSVIGLGQDLMKDPDSPEGRRANNLDVLASTAVLLGGLLGAPEVAIPALIFKFFHHGPSAAYDQDYGDLKRAFPG